MVESYDGAYIARRNSVGLYVSHTLEGVQFLNLCLFLSTVAVNNGDVLSSAQCSAVNTSHGDTSSVAGVVE